MNTTVTGVKGFKASAVSCDVRGLGNDRLDLALIYSELPCTGAAVFTTNQLAAAPVKLGREQLSPDKRYAGIIVNSGNANACTGSQGRVDAEAMRGKAASLLKCDEAALFVCSTGRIGRPLPMERIEGRLPELVEGLSCAEASGLKAADAILTSDTCRKLASKRIQIGGKDVCIAGMAKGAGMIEPNMATMLGFVVTDAEVPGNSLQALLAECVSKSFNAITVDGDSSTNDTVILLANGASGVTLSPERENWSIFERAVQDVCQELAQKIVGDGEKITKVVELVVEGALSRAEAESAARAVGNSLLVKSSWFGEDPNWGRLVDAVGYSGATVQEESIVLEYGLRGEDWVSIFSGGVVHLENKTEWERIVSEPRFRIRIDLGQGSGSFTLWATDLTDGYVNFNRSE